MRFTNHCSADTPICLALYGCDQLEKVADFINSFDQSYVEAGHAFTKGQLAGQYAFEQVKLDRKGYDSRRLQKYFSFLSDAGAQFDIDEAMTHADELINCYTADFGHDEDGDATFRIKAQCYRLKKYDCKALSDRVKQSTLEILSVVPENLMSEDELETEMNNEPVDFRVTCVLIDPQGEKFATLLQYISPTNGSLAVEDLIDYELFEYPNFHDESKAMLALMEEIAFNNRAKCFKAVLDFIEEQQVKNQSPALSSEVLLSNKALIIEPEISESKPFFMPKVASI